MSENRLVSPLQVRDEISRRNDDLREWGKARRAMFKRPNPELIRTVQNILNEHPRLVDPEEPNDQQADPFVIALAIVESRNTLGERWVVVTEETFKPNCIRIPHVCQARRIPYMSLHQMFMAEAWDL